MQSGRSAQRRDLSAGDRLATAADDEHVPVDDDGGGRCTLSPASARQQRRSRQRSRRAGEPGRRATAERVRSSSTSAAASHTRTAIGSSHACSVASSTSTTDLRRRREVLCRTARCDSSERIGRQDPPHRHVVLVTTPPTQVRPAAGNAGTSSGSAAVGGALDELGTPSCPSASSRSCGRAWRRSRVDRSVARSGGLASSGSRWRVPRSTTRQSCGGSSSSQPNGVITTRDAGVGALRPPSPARRCGRRRGRAARATAHAGGRSSSTCVARRLDLARRSWTTTPAITSSAPTRSSDDSVAARARCSPTTIAVTGSSARSTAKRRIGDPPQHVLIDAVADRVGEDADDERRREQGRRRPDVAAARRSERRERDGADREPDGEAGDAAVGRSDATADHDVGRPHRRGEEDEQQPERLGVDLDAGQHEHAGDGEQQCDRVAAGARERGGDGDRPDELHHDALAEVDAIDREVEEHVHQRRGDAEDRDRDEVGARPPAAEVASGDREQHDGGADHAEPRDRGGAGLVEHRHGDDRAGVLRDAGDDEQRLR